MMKTKFAFAPLFLAAVVVTGCGNRPPGIKTAKVQGIVTYAGQPISDAYVVFISDFGPRATGTTDVSGKYVLTTEKLNDGAVPGLYTVAISKTEPPDPKNIYATQKSIIPEKYSSPKTSGLKATVDAKELNDIGFNLEK